MAWNSGSDWSITYRSLGSDSFSTWSANDRAFGFESGWSWWKRAWNLFGVDDFVALDELVQDVWSGASVQRICWTSLLTVVDWCFNLSQKFFFDRLSNTLVALVGTFRVNCRVDSGSVVTTRQESNVLISRRVDVLVALWFDATSGSGFSLFFWSTRIVNTNPL